MTTPFDAPDWREHEPAGSRPRPQQRRRGGRQRRHRRRLGAAFGRHACAACHHLDLRTARASATASTSSKPPTAAPTLLFIHGGYWQGRAKEIFTRFAEGPMAHGINVALIGYTLAPDATLDEIVAEIHAGHRFSRRTIARARRRCERHRGVRLVRRRASDLDGAVASACQSGHGDQRHLRSRADPPQLSQRQARARRSDVAPQLADDAGRRRDEAAVAGGRSAELPLLRKQTADFAGHRARYGLPVTYEEIPGADHFTIMNEMTSPTGRITTLIRQLFERTAS